MIKQLLFVVFISGVLAGIDAENGRARLYFNDELVLPSFLNTDTTGDVVVRLDG